MSSPFGMFITAESLWRPKDRPRYQGTVLTLLPFFPDVPSRRIFTSCRIGCWCHLLVRFTYVTQLTSRLVVRNVKWFSPTEILSALYPPLFQVSVLFLNSFFPDNLSFVLVGSYPPPSETTLISSFFTVGIPKWLSFINDSPHEFFPIPIPISFSVLRSYRLRLPPPQNLQITQC